MAGLLTQPTDERHTVRNLLLIALVLVAAAAAGFAVFYRHENHAPLQATATRVLTLPLHVTYAHSGGDGGAVQVGAPDQTDDVVYVVTVLKVQDKADVPLFVKDLTGKVQLQDGGALDGRLITPRERERLLQLVPTIRPVIEKAGVPPLDPEQKIAPGTAAEGYTIFLYSMPGKAWDARASATVTLDFYHQDSVVVELPK